MLEYKGQGTVDFRTLPHALLAEGMQEIYEAIKVLVFLFVILQAMAAVVRREILDFLNSL